MGEQRYRLRQPDYVDLTRYVRTPAGVRRYHRPIGSPIGGGAEDKPAEFLKGYLSATTKSPEPVKLEARTASPPTLPNAKDDYAETRVGILRPKVRMENKPAPRSAMKFLLPKGSPAQQAAHFIKHAPEAVKVVGTMHKAFNELKPEEKRTAVRELRLALNGDRGPLEHIDIHTLHRVATDKTVKAKLREQAKTELRRRIEVTKQGKALTRKAAIESLKAGETPHHWLGMEPDGATTFDKALIRLHPKFASAFFRLRGRLRKTPTYKKLHRAKSTAAEKTAEHVKETGHEALHRGINTVAATGVALLASYVGMHLAGDDGPVKSVIDAVKDWTDTNPIGG